MKLIHTINISDVDRTIILAMRCGCCCPNLFSEKMHHGAYWLKVSDFMGKVIQKDIGKRIYKTKSGVHQVENDAQKDERVNR